MLVNLFCWIHKLILYYSCTVPVSNMSLLSLLMMICSPETTHFRFIFCQSQPILYIWWCCQVMQAESVYSTETTLYSGWEVPAIGRRSRIYWWIYWEIRPINIVGVVVFGSILLLNKLNPKLFIYKIPYMYFVFKSMLSSYSMEPKHHIVWVVPPTENRNYVWLKEKLFPSNINCITNLN